MKQLFQWIRDLRPYWIGALGGLLLSSAILGYRLHQQHQSYTENFDHAQSLALAQLQLLEAEFKPGNYLMGLYEEFGESHPGPVNEHIDILVHDHAFIRRGVAEATIANLRTERAEIEDGKAVAGLYDRVLDVAQSMYDKNEDAEPAAPYAVMMAEAGMASP